MTLQGKFGDPKTERDVISAKRFNFFALVVLIITICAGFLVTLQLLSNQRELEAKTQQLADSTANLRRIRSELEASQRLLDKHDSTMQHQLQDLSSSVEKRDFHVAIEQAESINTAMAKDSSGCTLVHLYAWQPQKGAMARINRYLKKPGYTLVREETLQDLPAWMGRRSAVYYYDPKVTGKAKTMAQELTRLTGSIFEALPGSADDAPDYDQRDWIHVHYLGADISLLR